MEPILYKNIRAPINIVIILEIEHQSYLKYTNNNNFLMILLICIYSAIQNKNIY